AVSFVETHQYANKRLLCLRFREIRRTAGGGCTDQRQNISSTHGRPDLHGPPIERILSGRKNPSALCKATAGVRARSIRARRKGHETEHCRSRAARLGCPWEMALGISSWQLQNCAIKA